MILLTFVTWNPLVCIDLLLASGSISWVCCFSYLCINEPCSLAILMLACQRNRFKLSSWLFCHPFYCRTLYHIHCASSISLGNHLIIQFHNSPGSCQQGNKHVLGMVSMALIRASWEQLVLLTLQLIRLDGKSSCSSCIASKALMQWWFGILVHQFFLRLRCREKMEILHCVLLGFG